MLYHRILLQSQFHLTGQLLTLPCQYLLLIDLTQDGGSLAKHTHSKEIAGDEEGEDGAVIRGTESTGYQSACLTGMTITVIAAGIMQSTCLTTEMIVGLHSVPVLLVTESGQDSLYHLYPLGIEDACVPRTLPILICKAERIAERVYLIFTLMEFLLHLCLVGLPFATDGPHIESVGIGIYHDAGKLSAYDTANKATQGFILIHIPEIWPHLSSTVSQPHGMDIPSVDKRVVIAIGITIVDGGVQRIGEAVGKHPVELRIDGRQLVLECQNLFLYGITTEQAVLLFGAHTLECALHSHMFLLSRSISRNVGRW